MATRTVVLKLVVPRVETPTAIGVRQALWRTHAEVNAATAHYERHLLLMRGARYQTGDTTVSDTDARAALIAHARSTQTTNIRRDHPENPPVPPGGDDDVVNAMKDLYSTIVPSFTGHEGSAQAANAHLSPLTDAASEGFMEASRKLDRPLPNWLSLVSGDPDAALQAANAWFESAAATEWRSDTGSPANWLRKARAGEAGWPLLFSEKVAALRKEIGEGAPGLYARLRTLHLLPLFPAYFRGRIADTDAAVTPWDRLAFRLAVAHLLSWESWSRRAAEEHARRTAILTKFRAEQLTGDVPGTIDALRVFERERSEYLSTLGLGASEYRLMRRQLRNWSDLRERWLKSGSADPHALMQIAKDEQARLRGRFGDPAVFSWLAAGPNQHVWRSTPDAVSLLATLNAMEALVARSRETALMTLPDPVAHPRAVQWSAVGDSNLRPYRIGLDAQGDCWAQLRLLAPRPDDPLLADQEVTLPLAASKQFRQPAFAMREKKAAVTFHAAGVDTFSGVLGSADLLLERSFLGRRPADALAAGDIGPAWLKISLDIDRILHEGWTNEAAKFVNHFRTASGKTSKHEAQAAAGNRVLSVDLGVGTFAACSVFSLTDRRPPAERFAFQIDVAGRALWALHERSFHLKLQDELTDHEGALWWRVQDQRLRRLRQVLSRYRRMLALAELSRESRAEALSALRSRLDEGDPFPFEADMVTGLEGSVEMADPVWAGAVKEMLARYRIAMGGVVKAWRREGRAKTNGRHSGPSMWSIQHLTDVRRLLLGWSLLGRRSGDVRRQDRAARGVFASRLLAHIDHLKENRLKSGADMIVQATRGYLRDKVGRWKLTHAPCDLVLFEDLARYRMLTDRPRRENSQLMLWAHRAMSGEVAMQGELYGLEVADTGAAFSSRFHARTMTPGIRCRSLTRTDMEEAFLRERLAADGIDVEALHPGDLVPWEGGEVFVSPRREGGLWQIDADINAAQNLQRRFWTRHRDAFRLPCRSAEVGGQQVFVPRSFGQRLLGAMDGHGVLMATGAESGACRWRPMKQAELRKLGLATGGEGATDEEGGTEEQELQHLAEQALEFTGKVLVFFRDPSGVVLRQDLWYPQQVFWSVVRSRITKSLLAGRHTD
jgi:hypothetical protein